MDNLSDLSDSEASLIRRLRRQRAGYHQLIISWLGPHWCVETSDLSANMPREVGHGDTFEEAWSRATTRLETPEAANDLTSGLDWRRVSQIAAPGDQRR
jgi:hypothetical protein